MVRVRACERDERHPQELSPRLPWRWPARHGMSAGGLAEQPFVLLRGCRLAAETAVVEGAVVVAAAGRHQAETAGQGSKPGTFGIIMIGMPHLDPSQTRGGQPDDDLVCYLVPRRARMGEDRHAARGAD